MKKIFLSIIVMVFIFIGWNIYNENENLTKGILNIKSVPSSIQNIECDSWGFTDILTACVFKINPTQFPLLLKGWNFTKTNVNYSYSHDIGGPKLGKNFLINESYIVHPKDYIHGGHVRVSTDKNNSNVIIDIYIE